MATEEASKSPKPARKAGDDDDDIVEEPEVYEEDYEEEEQMSAKKLREKLEKDALSARYAVALLVLLLALLLH